MVLSKSAMMYLVVRSADGDIACDLINLQTMTYCTSALCMLGLCRCLSTDTLAVHSWSWRCLGCGIHRPSSTDLPMHGGTVHCR
jgi:hypothetical protein